MAATKEKTEFMEVTIATDKGVAVRVNPEDMGKAHGPAELVERGTTIRVKRVIGNMMIANQQALEGKVDLKKAA